MVLYAKSGWIRFFSLSSQVIIDEDENEDCYDDEEEGDQPCSEVEQRCYVQETLFQSDAENNESDFEHVTT